MSHDVITLLYTATGFMMASVLYTIIYRDYGIYLFSYGISVAVGLLTAYWVDYYQGPGWIGLIVSAGFGGVLSLLQIPMISYFGGELFLLISVVAHLFMIQMWIAFPRLTGGTGGLFFRGNPDRGEVYIYIMILLSVVIYVIRAYVRCPSSVERAFLRYHGPRAAVFGVSSWQHYAVPFVMWGAVTAFSGAVMSRHLGFVSISALSVTVPVTLLLITALSSHMRSGLSTVVGLSFWYICLRFIPPILGNGSQSLAVFVDVAFPAIIYIIMRVLRPVEPFRRGGR